MFQSKFRLHVFLADAQEYNKRRGVCRRLVPENGGKCTLVTNVDESVRIRLYAPILATSSHDIPTVLEGIALATTSNWIWRIESESQGVVNRDIHMLEGEAPKPCSNTVRKSSK